VDRARARAREFIHMGLIDPAPAQIMQHHCIRRVLCDGVSCAHSGVPLHGLANPLHVHHEVGSLNRK
jgi:hypothetical protein